MKLPSEVKVRLPLVGGVIEVSEILSPSGSVSGGGLVITLPLTAVSSAVVKESSVASGLLTGALTVIFTVAVSVPPFPSLAV